MAGMSASDISVCPRVSAVSSLLCEFASGTERRYHGSVHCGDAEGHADKGGLRESGSSEDFTKFIRIVESRNGVSKIAVGMIRS